MAWVCFRKATEDDYKRIYAAADRFCKRHDISRHSSSAWACIENKLMYDSDEKYLAKLWYACVARAVKEPGAEGIAWDHIGKSE
jgi:hypothetical protein